MISVFVTFGAVAEILYLTIQLHFFHWEKFVFLGYSILISWGECIALSFAVKFSKSDSELPIDDEGLSSGKVKTLRCTRC
jgi:hypothetical protein